MMSKVLIRFLMTMRFVLFGIMNKSNGDFWYTASLYF